MSLSPQATTSVDDIVVLDTPSPQAVDPSTSQPSQDIIVVDNNSPPSRQTRPRETILVEESPPKRRRRDNPPQATPIAPPHPTQDTDTSVIVVDDDDDITPNTYQSSSADSIHQHTQPASVNHNSTNIQLPQPTQSNNIMPNMNPSTSQSTSQRLRDRNRRFFSLGNHLSISRLSGRNNNNNNQPSTLPSNNSEDDIIELAAAGPRVLSAASSASTPSTSRITPLQPTASSSTAPLMFSSRVASQTAAPIANPSTQNSTPSGFATLLAAANVADQSNSNQQHNSQNAQQQSRNAASMPSLLAFGEDQNSRHVQSFQLLRPRSIRRSRARQESQINNRMARAVQNVFPNNLFAARSDAAASRASDPFVGPASGTTPSPSIAIPAGDSAPTPEQQQSQSGVFRATAHVRNEGSGPSAIFVTLPQASPPHINQTTTGTPIVNLNTGEVYQSGHRHEAQQGSGSGSSASPYGSLHFIVASEGNFSIARSGTSSIGSIDTGDSQSTTQAQVRRRSIRRTPAAATYLAIRRADSRRAGSSENPHLHSMTDTQAAPSTGNGAGSSSNRNAIREYTIFGYDNNTTRTSGPSRQRGGVRQRNRHLIQFMHNGIGPPFEIQYIHGLAGDQELDYEQLIRLDEELVREKNRADKEQINALPMEKAKGEDKDIRCCICMCDVEEGEELRVLPCTHKYHKNCIDEWLTYNGCCPVDKKRIAPKTRRRSHGNRS